MTSWAAREDAGARAREAIQAGDRPETLRILAEQNGYPFALELLHSLNLDIARVTRPPAEA